MPTGISPTPRSVRDQLKAAGLRVDLDERQEKIGYKIREAQLQKVPYMLVVGDRESAEGHGVGADAHAAATREPQPIDAFIDAAREEIAAQGRAQDVVQPSAQRNSKEALSLSTEVPAATTACASTNASASAKSASSTTPAQQLGIMPPPQALAIAKQKGLDLVEISPTAVPPVCRIMDFGKYQYQEQKRAREARKHQKVIEVKEIKFRPKVDEHDYQFKKKHIERFLEDGDKVKATIFFRGREMAHPEIGRRILERLVDELAEVAIAETMPRLEGNQMHTILSAPAAERRRQGEGGRRRRRRRRSNDDAATVNEISEE